MVCQEGYLTGGSGQKMAQHPKMLTPGVSNQRGSFSQKAVSHIVISSHKGKKQKNMYDGGSIGPTELAYQSIQSRATITRGNPRYGGPSNYSGMAGP